MVQEALELFIPKDGMQKAIEQIEWEHLVYDEYPEV